MAYLTDVYNAISAQDQELEKEAAEIMKVAEEHDAAGRIMARGFADELNKLAGLREMLAEANDQFNEGGYQAHKLINTTRANAIANKREAIKQNKPRSPKLEAPPRPNIAPPKAPPPPPSVGGGVASFKPQTIPSGMPKTTGSLPNPNRLASR